MSNERPTDWKKVSLGEIATYVNGKVFKPTEWSKEGIPIIRIQNLNREKSEFNYCNFKVDDKFYVNKGDLLFAWSGTPDTSFGAHIWMGGNAVLNQHIFKILIDQNQIEKKYYFYALNHKVKEFVSNAHGTAGLAHITKKKFEQSELYLPPKSTQQAIVSKIEELFSEIEKGIESLSTAKQQLKIYRQSVLKWAFEGKLTNENLKEGELPEGWKWVKLGDISNLITKGASPKWQGIKYVDDSEQVLFVTSENVRENYIDISKPKYLELSFNKKQKRSVLRKGDVLLNIVGASIGRAAIYNLEVNANINQAVSVIRLPDEVSNKYACYYLNSNKALSYYNLNKVDFARANLSLADVGNVELSLPPIKEQNEIVLEIESRLSVTDKMEESINESLQQAEALKQSILKKAFEGRLT